MADTEKRENRTELWRRYIEERFSLCDAVSLEAGLLEPEAILR